MVKNTNGHPPDNEPTPYDDSIHDLYGRLMEALISFGGLSQLLIQTVVLSFGVLAILIILMVVEQHGIEAGLVWFLPDVDSARLGAWALVLFNVVVDVQIVQIEHINKHKDAARFAWSFRLAAGSIAYRLGVSQFKVGPVRIGKKWSARRLSPAQEFIFLKRLVTVAIFALALSGRMRPNIEAVSGVPLDEGLGLLFAESSIADVWHWIGGTLFTLVALVGVQRLTGFVAMSVIEQREEMKKAQVNRKRQRTLARRRAGGRTESGTRDESMIADASFVYYRVKPIRLSEYQTTESGTPLDYQCPVCKSEMTKSGWSRHSHKEITPANINEPEVIEHLESVGMLQTIRSKARAASGVVAGSGTSSDHNSSIIDQPQPAIVSANGKHPER